MAGRNGDACKWTHKKFKDQRVENSSKVPSNKRRYKISGRAQRILNL